MKSIFDNDDSIQVNPAWEYNEQEHKWTIDANDVIVHSELSEEIYKDFYKLDQYSLVLEEAYICYNRLTDQLIKNNSILDNSRVSLEEVSISNTCLNICKAQLGYDTNINYSSESDMTNYERLQVSNEGIVDFIKEIWEKIKVLFKKVYDFLKGIVIKLLKWLGLYKDNIAKMEKVLKEDVTNISNESYNREYRDAIDDLKIKINDISVANKLTLEPNTLINILDKIPVIAFNLTTKTTFEDILDIINPENLLKPFTKNYNKLIEGLVSCNLRDLFRNVYSPELSWLLREISHYANLKNDELKNLLYPKDKNGFKIDNRDIYYDPVLITNIYEHNNKTYAKVLFGATTVADVNGFLGHYLTINLIDILEVSYSKNKYNFQEIVMNMIGTVYTQKSIDKLFNGVRNIETNLKQYEYNIKKIQSNILNKLVNTNDEDILYRIKKNKKLFKELGTDIPMDILKYMHSTMKIFLNIITLMYDDKKKQATSHYGIHCDSIKHALGLENVTFKYMKESTKEYPYYEIEAKDDVSNIACVTPIEVNINKTKSIDYVICLSKKFVNRELEINIEKQNISELKKVIDNTLRDFGIPNNDIFDYTTFCTTSNDVDLYLLLLYVTITDDRFNNELIDKLKSTAFSHLHSLTPDMLKLKVMRYSKKLPKDITDNDIKLMLKLTLRKHLINYFNAYTGDEKIITFTKKDVMVAYFHEMGHCILRQNEISDGSGYFSHQHLEIPEEIQADCYSMVRAGLSIDEMIDLRVNKLCLLESFYPTGDMILKYRDNLIKYLPRVMEWTGISKLNHYYTKLKNQGDKEIFNIYKSIKNL